MELELSFVELGKKLYEEYRRVDNYSITKENFSKLTHDEEKEIMKGFIEQRKINVPEESENDHIVTFWAMLDELQ